MSKPRDARTTRARLNELESLYRGIRPWLLVRDEDAVLIVPPNRVYKLGGSALELFAWLDKGGRLFELPGLDEDGVRLGELQRFFDELAAAYQGSAPEAGFDRIPYDFSFTKLPILGELALTYRCNERCRFCYAGCGDSGCARGEEENELTTDEWKNIIRVFKDEAKIPFFSFTGGEPLLRPDLEELARFAIGLGLRVNLITNGSLATPERAMSLKASGIDTAQVSLESPDPAIHDELCGVQGAWERTTSGIRALIEAGVSVQTNSTITSLNRASLLGLPELLRSLGVARFSANLFIPAGRGLSQDELFVSYSEVGPFVDELRRAAQLAERSFFWYSPTPYCLYNPVARGLGNKSCAAVDGLIHVNPKGEVLPCSSWPESLGSLLSGTFKEIWFSERSSYFKNKHFAPQACAGCDRFVACQGACPLYWAYAGEDELARVDARGAEGEAFGKTLSRSA